MVSQQLFLLQELSGLCRFVKRVEVLLDESIVVVMTATVTVDISLHYHRVLLQVEVAQTLAVKDHECLEEVVVPLLLEHAFDVNWNHVYKCFQLALENDEPITVIQDVKTFPQSL